MSRLSRKSLFDLPRGFAVEKVVLPAGSLAACVAAGLGVLHLLRFPATPGQLPGALSAAGLSPSSNTIGWLVPVAVVPLLWIAWLALLPRMASRWPRGPGAFYRDALGLHFALLAAPFLLLRGADPFLAGFLVPAAGLAASAAWIFRTRLLRAARLLAGPDGGPLACGAAGLALATFAAGCWTPATLLGQWTLFGGIAAGVAGAAILLSRGSAERFSVTARSAGALSLAPAVVVAGARSAAAGAALLAAGILLAFAARRLSSQTVRKLSAAGAVPILLASSVWIAAYRPLAPVSLFEDGHALGPAWEESQGGRAFEATLPLHGWLEDGGYESFSFRLFGPSYEAFRVRRGLFSIAAVVSIYLLATAVFGQGALPVAATGIAYLLSRGGAGPRAAPSLLAAALFALGIRRGSRSVTALGAALSSASLFSSLDFGAYTLAAAAAAWIAISLLDAEFRRRFPPALLAASAALGAAPFVAVLAATGRLSRWLDFSLRILPRLAREAYALPIPDLLASPPGFPRARFILDPVLFAFGLAVAVRLTRRRHPWGRGLLFCAASYFFTYRSVAERLYVRRGALFLGILLTAAAVLAANAVRLATASLLADRSIPWWRRRSAAVALFLAVSGAGTATLAYAATRGASASLMNGWVAWPARGASPAATARVPGPFGDGAETTPETARRLSALKAFFDRRLGPDETFFDFSNQPGIHFLLNRRNPVPWPETPAMEEPGAQRRIMDALASRNVCYVLWSWPGEPPDSYSEFDSVPNRVRVPELYEYLEKRYPGQETVEGCEIRFRRENASGAPPRGLTAPGSSRGTTGTARRLP